MSNKNVAVVIPVYNDAEGIQRTLNSLDSSAEPNRMVTVVDNGSTDDSVQVIKQFTSTNIDISLRFETQVQSSYAARNSGIKSTDTDIIAFVDANMIVPDGYLSHGINYMTEKGVDYMGCCVNLSTVGSAQTLIGRYNSLTGFPIQQYIDRHRYAPTCSLFVRRQVFEDMGLFDPRLISGGDMEFGNRVNAAGYDMGYCADAVVHHPVRSSFRSLYGKNVRVGRGHCQLQRYYPERYGTPPIPPRHEPLDTESDALPLDDRLAFGALSTAMTAARASGYARELASPSDTGANVDGPPEL